MKNLLTLCMAAIMFFAAKAQPTNGLRLKWTFTNASLSDDIQSLTLRNNNGVKFSNDRFGNPSSAVLLDGIDDYLNTEVNVYSPARPYTISVWFRTTNPGKTDGQCFFNTDAHRHIYLGYNTFNTGTFEVGLGDGNNWTNCGKNTGLDTFSAAGTNMRTWNHLAIVHDSAAGRWTYYLNNQVVGTCNSGNAADANIALYFGRIAQFNQHHFEGYLDDIFIYERPLSASEISQLYNAPNPTPHSGLVAKYTFDYGTTDNEAGNSNGVADGVTPTFDRFGNPNKAMSFDGVDDRIFFGDEPEFKMGHNDFTISLWVKKRNNHAGAILCKRNDHPTFDQYSVFTSSLVSTGNGIIAYYKPSPGGVGNPQVREVQTPDIDTAWHHIVVVNRYTDSTSIYLDGNLVVSANTFYDWRSFDINGAQLVAGHANVLGTNYYFDGAMDDIYIFKKALTTAEILSLYNAPNPVSNRGLIAQYSFNSGNTNDDIGNNHATAIGATLTTDRFGNANKAYRLDGLDDYISLGYSQVLKSPVGSVSLWVRMLGVSDAGTGYNYNPIYLNKNTTTGSAFIEGTSIYLNRGPRTIMAVTTKFSPLQEVYQSTNDSIRVGEWAHLVLTFDNDSATFYLNNQRAFAYAKPFVLSFNPLEPVYIGTSNEPWNMRFFHGDVDDIKIYNRIITPAEVNSLFREPNPVTTSGINETANNKQINVYPNPTNGLLQLSKPATGIITDLFGKELIRFADKQLIDLCNLERGIYLIRIDVNESPQTQTTRILKY